MNTKTLVVCLVLLVATTVACGSGENSSTTSPDGGASNVMDAGTGTPASDGNPVDGGTEGGDSIQCNFPGGSPALSCSGNEYCMAFGGGVPIDSGISYTCQPIPDACLADHSCACVCGTAISNPGSYCAVRGQQCICSASEGAVTLLCAVP